MIELAFKKLDKTGDGIVTLDDLRGVYNIRSHPEYQNGQKSEKELLEGFLKKFEEGGSVDGKVCLKCRTFLFTTNVLSFV